MVEHYKNLSLEDIEGEKWKDIVGYEGSYQVSNMGRVKSFNYRTKNKVAILTQLFSKKGYLMVVLQNSARFKTGVHRLVAIAFIPNPENKPEVNHKKGIKTDNRASELEWSTTKENIQHAFDSGIKHAKGEKNNFHILTEEQILEIRRDYAPGSYGQKRQMALKYGVHPGTIKNIYLNRAWKHLLPSNQEIS